jgi:hypothetical protein
MSNAYTLKYCIINELDANEHQNTFSFDISGHAVRLTIFSVLVSYICCMH